MSHFKEWSSAIIKSNRFILIDGGFATLLERNGLKLNSVGERCVSPIISNSHNFTGSLEC